MRWLIGDKAFDTLAHWLYGLIGIQAGVLARLLDTLFLLFMALLLHRLLRGAMLKRIEEPSRRYFASKTLTYILSGFTLLVLTLIWIRAEVELATYLGILSAGLAVALADPITNMAGWLFLMVRQPFKVGDRIQLGQQAGDVIDIRLFQFSMLEIGGWVSADQSTGRIIHVPNGRIFKESLCNATQGFGYIWHEIPVTVTFESNWQKAESLLSDIIAVHVEQESSIMARQLQSLSNRFAVHFRHLTPIVWVKVIDYGVTLTLRYLCQPRKRRSSEHVVWRDILKAFAAESDIDFAYPTQRFYDNRLEGKDGSRASQSQPVSE
jgi:small-conductance mechanosensitive channel